GGDVGPDADGQEHVAELADRRVGEDLLDVVLGHRDGGGDEGGHHAHPGDDVRRPVVAGGQDGVDPGHEEHAAGHHRRGEDERRDRRRARHGVGQPDVQRDLGRLAGGAEEEEQRDGGGRHARQLAGAGGQLAVVDGAQRGEGEEDGEQEAPVADPVGDERLLAGRGVGLVGEPERDEQVGAEADALPPDEGDEEVAAQDEQQHREDEEVEVDEELGEVGGPVHVADRVQVDERADAGDEQRHGDRQRVGQEADVHLEVADRHPLEEGGDRRPGVLLLDRKSTRLNSSHVKNSYAVFCLKKKTTYTSLPSVT